MPRATKKQASESSLVKMIRDGKIADVHPSEVESWKQYGWQVLEDRQG